MAPTRERRSQRLEQQKTRDIGLNNSSGHSKFLDMKNFKAVITKMARKETSPRPTSATAVDLSVYSYILCDEKAKKSSISLTLSAIREAIANAKHNKLHISHFQDILQRLVKVLNGVDTNFVRQAEFYSDLKETLIKMKAHIDESSSRGRIANKILAKRDQKLFEEFDKHMEHLITRIVFAYAQRVESMRALRMRKRRESVRHNSESHSASVN